MNSKNYPSNKHDQDHANSAWAEIVEERNQLTRSGKFKVDEVGFVADNADLAGGIGLSPERLADLELDGQLRVLRTMFDTEESFVEAVVAQTHPESNLAQQKRSRLPVLKPLFISEDTETDEEMVHASATGDSSDLRQREIIPSDLIPSNLIPSVATSSHSSSATLSRPTSHRRSTARFASIVTIFIIACLFGTSSWLRNKSQTAAIPKARNIAAEQGDSESILDRSIDLEQDAQEFTSAKDAVSNRFLSGEASAEELKHESLNEGSMIALAKETATNDWNDILEQFYDADSKVKHDNPSFASAVDSAARDLLPSGNEEHLEDQNVEISSFDGPQWDSQLEWNLALQFQKNGLGSVTLNGKLLQAVLLQDNAAFLLREISAQLQRRVSFLQNRLGSRVNGSISVNKTRYDFDRISELDETVEKVEQCIAKLNIRALSVQDLMTIRAKCREEILADQRSFHSIDLAGKNLRFYTEDEVFTVCSVLSTSEALLRGLARKRLVWEKNEDIYSTETKRKICIAPTDFLLFAKSGALHLPDPIYSGQSIATIQGLYPSELLSMLQTVRSVELFRNMEEFQKAKDYVFANGPPEMKLRLSIDKRDRFLANTSSVSDGMRRLFADSNRRTVAKMDSARARSANPADGIAMQPLLDVLAKREDLQGLPLAMGNECKSDAAEIHDLKQVSFSVGRTIGEFNGSLGSRDAAQNDAFRNLSIKKMVSLCMQDHAANPTSQKLKTINQILQIDHPRLRLEMIESLRDSNTNAAIALMVNKAKYDFEPEVRIAATEALSDIDAGQYRQSFLEGLNYPWHVVAEHSAEALVRLNDQGAIPNLIDMLDLPHPQYPFESDGVLVQRELVGINHMRNCLLCHAPSISESDSVRGLIPHTNRPVPRHYYDTVGASDIPFAIRADITYLEQDFSVVRPVVNSAPWPREQRFDYVVQKKRLAPKEAEQLARQLNQTPNRNRNAIIFALRELTGVTPADNSANNWRNVVAAIEKEKK